MSIQYLYLKNILIQKVLFSWRPFLYIFSWKPNAAKMKILDQSKWCSMNEKNYRYDEFDLTLSDLHSIL